jgi:DtxR family Mn-dependent transcriptional regulator
VATSTVENYIKRLYIQQQRHAGRRVPMGKLATAMRVAPGTATAMVKSLSDMALVDYRPRAGTRLTASGEKLALDILRRHRLVELFLVNVLGLDWSEVHDEAERLEHAVSDKVLDRLDEILGYPQADPHGDPIPPARGKIKRQQLRTLADPDVDGPIRIVRVSDQDGDFLRFVDRSGLMPGTEATVVHRDVAADAVTVETDAGASATLGTTAAAKILVESSTARRNRR